MGLRETFFSYFRQFVPFLSFLTYKVELDETQNQYLTSCFESAFVDMVFVIPCRLRERGVCFS
jgi:hypothetical protein